MARHLNRAELLSAYGTHLRYITEAQAYAQIDAGEAVKLRCNRSLAKGKQLVIQLRDHRRVQRVIATLTERDMERNAESAAETGKETMRVHQWPTVYDTFAVTIVAGRGVFIPDPVKAAERAQR
jgi:hypothetical protein